MHLLVRLADALNMGFKFGYMVAQKLHCQPVRCLQRIVPVFIARNSAVMVACSRCSRSHSSKGSDTITACYLANGSKVTSSESGRIDLTA